ncbi:unnamed protein product [Schistocephalus solidus]|uniref:RNase H domain-containing protein n=1 Tax=Schistocephalus solidus TaxID=70667 RepID=A0A183T0R9_SCHSO|nr:unnamed protein product [Schistocephalus solidus]
MAVDAVFVGVPSFEESSCLPGVSYGNHFSSVPIEAEVTVDGVHKREGQGIASADGQFMFLYAGPKVSTHMAYIPPNSSSNDDAKLREIFKLVLESNFNIKMIAEIFIFLKLTAFQTIVHPDISLSYIPLIFLTGLS